jgi:hypothetical protein
MKALRTWKYWTRLAAFTIALMSGQVIYSLSFWRSALVLFPAIVIFDVLLDIGVAKDHA